MTPSTKSCAQIGRSSPMGNLTIEEARYRNSLITFSRVISRSSSLTPFSYFLSLSSTNSEMYSGVQGFKLMKNSKHFGTNCYF
ncbi:hypothetical protein MTR_7g039670 [Medicago truncatula]|uniref:Uncharacterized protein n=1 Tax=Medicago truncatula TaxID=3880 RepID=A0A072TYU2_MEDTR|nr:hypothetical protein MTR_7g039670 [Medicago truncatula]